MNASGYELAEKILRRASKFGEQKGAAHRADLVVLTARKLNLLGEQISDLEDLIRDRPIAR